MAVDMPATWRRLSNKADVLKRTPMIQEERVGPYYRFATKAEFALFFLWVPSQKISGLIWRERLTFRCYVPDGREICAEDVESFLK
jgi:hypothetical protein